MLSALVTYSVLAMGLANLFWMPIALCFGKRPVVLISMAMFLGGIIWSAVAQTYNSLLASRIFASFGMMKILINYPMTSSLIPYRIWRY